MKTIEVIKIEDGQITIRHTEDVADERIPQKLNLHSKQAQIYQMQEGVTHRARFKPDQPFPSWTYESGVWTPPVPMPDDGKDYTWNEDAGQWDEVTQ